MVFEEKLEVLVRQFIEYLELEKNCSRLTIIKYQHYLGVFLKYLEDNNKKTTIKSLNMENIRMFRLYLARQPGRFGDMKIQTQGYYVIVMRSFLKWLVRNDYEVLQPEKLEVPKFRDHSIKFLNSEQVNKLLNQPILSTKIGLRDKVILELLFSTGLRISELVSLNRNQIDLKTREFGIIGKGGRGRVVFISKRTLPFLGRYLVSRSDKEMALFIRYGGNLSSSSRLTARYIQKIVRKYVLQAKLPVDATPHTLRHSMATDLLREGADIRSVQEILGHKNIATTQIYTHVTDARLREIHDKFHAGNKKDGV
jgi:site-specific recombinase XerD